MTKVLGLDIGISSIGFALIDEDAKKIEVMGVHLFDAAENPKNGSSLAQPRREARGSRRLVRRRTMRKKALIRLFREQGFSDVEKITPDVEKGIPPLTKDDLSPWKLRSEGLERKLTDLEFMRALYHMAKHRGFQSNRKDSSKAVDAKMNAAMDKLKQDFSKLGKETIGAHLNSLPKQRNSNGEYSHTVRREMVDEEIDKIFEKQRGFENPKATQEIQDQVRKIIIPQRPLKSVDHMRGNCTHLPEEKRAPKCSFSAEQFLFYSKLNNLKLLTASGEQPITPEMRKKLWEEALESSSISYSHIRAIWEISPDVRFNLVNYDSPKNSKNNDEKNVGKLEDCEKDKFFEFKGYSTLRKIIKAHNSALWDQWKENILILDHIAESVSFLFDAEQIENKLKENAHLANAPQELLDKIIKINSFSKTVNLSIEAISILLPHLREGKRYDEAVSSARESGKFQDHQKAQASLKLPPLLKTNNPVVDRAVAQTRKIINAVIQRYGKPYTIRIELARELGKNFAKRKQIEKSQNDNKKKNDTIKVKIRNKFKFEAKRADVIKYKLWIEQKKRCAYSGDDINQENLFDGETCEVDHILPLRRSYDDSYMNKVLVFTKMNRDKINLTPYERWGGNEERWRELENFSKELPEKKRRNFLLKNFNAVENDWKTRHLNDTRYIARYFKEHVEKHFHKVETISGGITSYLRHRWGLGIKDREKDHKHHGVDAAIIACTSMAVVQRVTEFDKRLEWENLKKVIPAATKPYTPAPWEEFREDVERCKEKLFVSRLPNRKLRGEAHKATIFSYRKLNPEGKKVIKRIRLASLTSQDLEKMVDKDRNLKLYNVLAERLKANNSDPKKAFSKPVYMPRNDGSQGPQIKGIRIYENASGIPIRKGYAGNGDMVRVDVFSKPNKKGVAEYYLCPIYVMDAMRGVLPNKIYVNKKDVIIDDTYTFMFSLQKNDLVEVKEKKGEILLGYFVSMDRCNGTIKMDRCNGRKTKDSNGTITYVEPDRPRVSTKTALSIKKYNINYFGEAHEVKKETRREIKLGN